jgi:hypothetical protein
MIQNYAPRGSTTSGFDTATCFVSRSGTGATVADTAEGGWNYAA